MKERLVGEFYPVRFRPYRARAVHAGRDAMSGLWSACRYHAVQAWDRSNTILPPDTEVTCHGCLRQMGRAADRTQLYAWTGSFDG